MDRVQPNDGRYRPHHDVGKNSRQSKMKRREQCTEGRWKEDRV
jgi:hypothetical protein